MKVANIFTVQPEERVIALICIRSATIVDCSKTFDVDPISVVDTSV